LASLLLRERRNVVLYDWAMTVGSITHFLGLQMKFQQLAPLALIALTSAAFADGFYGVGEITRSNTALDKGYFDGALGNNGASGLSSHDSGNGNQWRLQGGYRFNPNLAIEAGYLDFGTAKYKANYAGGTAHGSLKAGGVDVVGLASIPLSDDFSVFGKAGLVYANVKSSLSASDPAALASDNNSTRVLRPLLGVGASYKITQNADLRVDFDHVSGLGKSATTGKMNDNMLSLGVAYHF